jgi:predicted lipoprotein with Yx(FWY)xxD motif
MSLPSSWRAGAAALLLAAPLALSGCSATTSGVPASLAAPVGNGSPIGGPTVDAGRDSLSTAATFVGTVMTSGGFTLYRNTKDKAVPPTSSCLGTCTSTWSPIGGAAQPILDGVDATLIGTLVRPDGTKQLTVDGWPVYRYIKDMLPGTVNGQGVDGVWQAVGPDGKPLTEKAVPAAAPAPPKKAPAKAAPAKPPAAAPKVVAPPTKAPAAAPKVTPKPTVAPKPTVVRDAPGTSSTD